MDKAYKVGIIGLGVVGERVLKQFLSHPRFDVLAFCEPNQARLKDIQDQYGQVLTYSSDDELLKNDDIDLVYLAVPPKFHHAIALNIIAHGKHILCEKPLANSEKEAREMFEAAENKGVVNAMNFPLPYHAEFFKMLEILEAGQLGDIQRIEFNMFFPEWPRAWQQNNWIATREQGGFIREIGPHYLHLISRLAGIPKYVQSFVDYPEDPSLSENGFTARLMVDQTPVLFNGVSNVGQKEDLSLKLYGNKAVLELRNWRDLFIGTREKNLERIETSNTSTKNLMEELVKALDGHDAHLITFEEGYHIQKLLENIINS
ncbi:Gfo/Idh/MocA family oxidoreductase [Filobacillus milosensis]|uniref:Gfo/Idh/MocA family oxidoreductase n=1 Tax=Filobacillus milosensis TaxID=94137 RepID=A0A4Y8ICS2_9BACI|nr:Gfo/Idh/MocA family oxidoreductase [Filobacillus milosensis]TFB12833.1 Gfo/Idh/MocA family oxidoreductase [Filobacillus milosensis]